MYILYPSSELCANYRKYLEKDYIFREYIHGNDRVTSSALDRYTG